MPGLEDILNITLLLKPYLLAVGIAFILALLICLLVFSRSRARRMLIRGNAWVIFVLVLVLTVNLVFLGPAQAAMNDRFVTWQVLSETMDAALQCNEAIAAQGITLLKNDGMLPLGNPSINVFGWSSVAPVYGCTDTTGAVSLLDGLKSAGLTLNDALADFYTSHQPSRNGDSDLPEPGKDAYPAELLQGASAFSDSALFVIARPAFGEAAQDSQRHDLQLTAQEEAALSLVCSRFSKVAVILNTAAPMELGVINTLPQVKAILHVPCPGATGFKALGSILTGAINPSGRTADTWLRDYSASPIWNNRVSTPYTNSDAHLLRYAEGIYNGYKYYETAAADGCLDYDAVVQYPFGYGLSYTAFEHQLSDVQETDGVLRFQVMVTNTGSLAGRDVVQVYCQAPYTGITEKAAVNLIAFRKTICLEPGNSQSISFEIPLEELASYDAARQQWVLEAGDYHIRIQSNAHTLLESKIHTVTEEQLFAQEAPLPGTTGSVLSRKNLFSNMASITAAPGISGLLETQLEQLAATSGYDPLAHNIPTDQMPVTHADSGIALQRLRGLGYDDPAWDAYLDQLRIRDMTELVTDADLLSSSGANPMCGMAMLGCTWSSECAAEYGSAVAALAADRNEAAWNGLILSLHRDPFAANYEKLLSEDAVLTGTLAAAALEGAERENVICCVSGLLSVGNSDTLVCSWADQQALHEVWLKPFAIALKSGHCGAVILDRAMLGFTPIFSCESFVTTLLRQQWGFRGIIAATNWEYADLALRSGCDLCPGASIQDAVSPTAVLALRSSSQNILFATINSRLYGDEVLDPGITGWMTVMFGIDLFLAVVLILWELLLIRRFRKLSRRRAAWLSPAPRSEKAPIPAPDPDHEQRSDDHDSTIDQKADS